jgi:hypothetical protein
MKYIIVKDREDDEHAIVFPDEIIHKDVARIHRATDVRFISAGFCDMETLQCWGKSESLNRESRPEEDSQVLKKDFNRTPGRES